MTTVAVVAHSRKSLGGGLAQLREMLRSQGVDDPLWYEVAKSKLAPGAVRQALADGADLIFAWGGDGTVQRCIDEVAGTGVTLAILPAGTANLLATNLGIPKDLPAAVEIGLHGDRRAIDAATMNGEHFAVMAGAGLDALMIRDADRGLKDRVGRAAYVWTGAKHLAADPVRASVMLDGRPFFVGELSCVLVGNCSQVLGGIEVFDGSSPDDGLLELGLVTARNRLQWVRTLARVALDHAEQSPFVLTARGRKVKVRFDVAMPYELDGGDRKPTRTLRVKVRPAAVTIAVPSAGSPGTGGGGAPQARRNRPTDADAPAQPRKDGPDHG
ncbi:MAG TPA: diacylglycerol kinase family protein [Candidatus Nanopelagicales bacterium]